MSLHAIFRCCKPLLWGLLLAVVYGAWAQSVAPTPPVLPPPTPSSGSSILSAASVYAAEEPEGVETGMTASVPGVALGFAAIDGSNGPVPPDTHIAVGPGLAAAGRVVMVTNHGIKIWTKAGAGVAGRITLAAFFNVTSGNTVFDPKVLYDQHSGRFFVVALEGNTAATSRLHLAVSTSSTPKNLTTEWRKLSGGAAGVYGAQQTWFDYPCLGADYASLVVTGNMFNDSRTFKGVKIRVFNKAAVLAGNYTYTDLHLDYATLSVGTVQPAHVYGSTDNGNFYLAENYGPEAYRLWEIIGGPTAPSIVSSGLRPWRYASAINSGAPQAGTSVRIDTVPQRVMQAVYRDGALWATATVDADGDAASEVFWAKIATNGAAADARLLDSGYIDGSTADAWTYLPALNVNSHGEAAICYTQSSPSQYPDMRYVFRRATDAPGTFQPPVLVTSSVGYYDSFSTRNPDRWGDYAGCVVDPDDGSFWLANEYTKVSGAGNSMWGTYIAKTPSLAYYQPDLLFRATGQRPYAGNNIYNDLDQQTVSCALRRQEMASYDVLLQNDGESPDQLRLTGTGGSGDLHIRYWSGSQEITAAVIGTGWSLTLAPGGETTVRVEIVSTPEGVAGATATVTLTATSGLTPTASDTARFVATIPPLSAVALTASPSTPCLVGTPVSLTADATGGANVEYMFRVGYKAQETWYWSVIKQYSPTRVCLWKPTVARTYTLVAYAREVGSTAMYQAYRAISVTVTAPTLSGVKLSADPEAPCPAGTTIRLTATALGGAAEYRFRVGQRINGAWVWTFLNTYGPSNTVTWTPTEAGSYTLVVYARAVGSTTGYDVYASRRYDVTP